MSQLPLLFLNRLGQILPAEHFAEVQRIFSLERPLTVRINSLKAGEAKIREELHQENIGFEQVPWDRQALILKNISGRKYFEHRLVKQGYLYIQSLSSMLPALVLDPQPGDFVLDLCAAPGSKTTQIAALMNNQGRIVAVEHIRGRYYKLRSVVEQLGVSNVHFIMSDGRKYRGEILPLFVRQDAGSKKFLNQQLFDKILVDAPCSSEGRFRAADKESFAYWSPRKIKEMMQKQRGLLLSASRLLKPGGVLVYSTCTFAPEENEGVVDWLLKKTQGILQVAPVELPGVERYPAVTAWGKKSFSKEVQHCFRVLPTEIMEGFFVAKLKKV